VKERLTYLFGQYVKNASSSDELEEFLSFVKKAEYDQTLRGLVQEVFNSIYASDPTITSYIDQSGSLVLTTPEFPQQDPAGSYYPGIGRKRKRKMLLGLLTSVAVIAVIAGMLWWKEWSAAPGRREQLAVQTMTRKITESSEQKFLLLPDSTQVWLNGNSYLEFPDEFSDKKREVFLSGEAWFDVRHADEIPFIIHTGKITTTVLGTSFNIKAYPYLKTVMISVSKGKVRVSREDHIVAVLEKGQQVRVSNVDSMITQKNIDVGNIAFWQQGYVSYDDEKIGEIVQDLEHLNNVVITVTDQPLLDTRITTSFNRSIGVVQELKLICKLIDKQLTMRNGQYIIE
jgi:transmembrane sensor